MLSPAWTKLEPVAVLAFFSTLISSGSACNWADTASAFISVGVHHTSCVSEIFCSGVTVVSVLVMVEDWILSVDCLFVPLLFVVPATIVPAVLPVVAVVVPSLVLMVPFLLVLVPATLLSVRSPVSCVWFGVAIGSVWLGSWPGCSCPSFWFGSSLALPAPACGSVCSIPTSVASVVPLSFKNITVPVIAIAKRMIIPTIMVIIVFLFWSLKLSAMKTPPFYITSLAFNISLCLFPFVHVIKVTSLTVLSLVCKIDTSLGSVTKIS